MSKVYHLSVSGPAENQRYKDAIAKIIKECLIENDSAFDVFLSDEDSYTLFKTEKDGKSFTVRKDLFPALFNASATIESKNAKSEDIKEEKNLNAKLLTEEEKGFFGRSYIDAEGTSYHAGDFVRALVAGDCYSRDDVGIVITTDSGDPSTPLLVYFGDAETEY